MSFDKRQDEVDELTRRMQDEAIKISSKRLGYPLPKLLEDKIRQRKWSYMGLEMIIDTVKSIKLSELENYLSKLH